MEYTTEQIAEIVAEAKHEANSAATKFFKEKLGGVDQYSCGFAFVDIYKVRSNSRLGKALIANGFRKSYTGSLQLWNPSGLTVQNIDTLEAGADAAARVLSERLGIESVYAGSRLD